MTWNLEVSSVPAQEPLTLQEAKDHLRIRHNDDDVLVGDALKAARLFVEGSVSKSLITQTLKLRLDAFPCSGRIYLPHGPTQSVTSISYKEAVAGATTTLSTSVYSVYGARTTPDAQAPVAYITTAPSQSWPSLYCVPEAVTITYVAGWLTPEDVPMPIRHAIKVVLADLYEQRETIVTGTIVANLDTVERLLANQRFYHDFGSDCG